MNEAADWIKTATDVFDNPKIKIIESMPEGLGLIAIWWKLLCEAGKTNDNGRIYITEGVPYTPETLSVTLRITNALSQLALTTFLNFKMIEYDDDGYIHIINWSKYQNVEVLDKMKEKNRLRQARYREKIKLLSQKSDVTQNEKASENNNVTNNVMSRCDSNVTVTLRNARDRDRERDIDNKREIESKEKSDALRYGNASDVKRKRFTPPTMEELKAYAQEKHYTTFDAELFMSHYESVGWRVGNNPMKSWQAAVRTWVKRDKNKQRASDAAAPNRQHNFVERQDDLDALVQQRHISGYG